MPYLIVSWFLGALSLMIVAYLVPGFVVHSFGAALVAALVIALVNSTLGVLLKILTLPLTIVTFGFFLFVINAFILRMVSGLVGGVRSRGLRRRTRGCHRAGPRLDDLAPCGLRMSRLCAPTLGA